MFFCGLESGNKKMLPKPPPPPPKPEESNEWYIGKNLMRLVKGDQGNDVPSYPEDDGQRYSVGGVSGVAGLFPNTTAAIFREREVRSLMDPKERIRLETWWRRQLAVEDADLKPGAPPPIPSDFRFAFEARIMHPASAAILRILVHFTSEFLSNDAVGVVSGGGLGKWTLPALVHAFIFQIESLVALHPLWVAEFQASTASASRSNGSFLARASLSAQQLRMDAVWDGTCDEIEAFIFRKIGPVLLPVAPISFRPPLPSEKSPERTAATAEAVAPPLAPPPSQSLAATSPSSSASLPPPPPPPPRLEGKAQPVDGMATGDSRVEDSEPRHHGGGGGGGSAWNGDGAPEEGGRARSFTSISLSRRLSVLGWITSTHLGVSWGGLDKPSDWAAASAELASVALCHPPKEKLECLVRCFAHVARSLSALLERVRLANVPIGASSAASSAAAHASGPVSPAADDEADGEWATRSGRNFSFSYPMAPEPPPLPSLPMDLPSADDVLPAVILVLLQADPPQLMAHLDLAVGFRSSTRLDPEGHYFSVTVTSAAHFLTDLEGPQLGMTTQAFDARLAEAERAADAKARLDAEEAARGELEAKVAATQAERDRAAAEREAERAKAAAAQEAAITAAAREVLAEAEARAPKARESMVEILPSTAAAMRK
jgi:hypothetical protein